MGHPVAKKSTMETVAAVLLLGGLFLSLLSGCAGGEKYQVDYCGAKDLYSNAKDAYRAGTAVTLYFEMIATDTDYSFLLDGESVPYTYHEKKGFVISFTMPDHDVTLECCSVNSMLPMDGGYSGGNPVMESSLAALTEETGYVLTLSEEVWAEDAVVRLDTLPPIYSVDFFSLEDGKSYNFRLQCGSTETDISGMYYEWTNREECAEPPAEVFWNEEGQGICLWQDENSVFSLSMSEDATREELIRMREVLGQALETVA